MEFENQSDYKIIELGKVKGLNAGVLVLVLGVLVETLGVYLSSAYCQVYKAVYVFPGAMYLILGTFGAFGAESKYARGFLGLKAALVVYNAFVLAYGTSTVLILLALENAKVCKSPQCVNIRDYSEIIFIGITSVLIPFISIGILIFSIITLRKHNRV
jgi:hypothetical protein